MVGGRELGERPRDNAGACRTESRSVQPIFPLSGHRSYNPEVQSAACPLQETEFMTKKDIARAIAEQTGLPQMQMLEIVQKTFDAITATLIAERRIELRGFGVFEVRKRSARRARNPRTGEKVFVPEKFVVTFKPSKEMNDRIGIPAKTPAETSAAT